MIIPHGDEPMKLGILLSGRGSNMIAIAEAIVAQKLDAEIVMVVSDRPDAKGLALAQSMGLPTAAFSPKDFTDKAAYEQAIQSHLDSVGVEWVVLAGYMRLLSEPLLQSYPDRILNIHPSLLPHFKGLHPQRQALAAGHTTSGCTVHLVTADLDAGPILGQRTVPVLPADTEATLAERILVEEHQLYPEILAALSSGQLTIQNGDVCHHN